MELVELTGVGHEQQFHLRELCGRDAVLAEIDAWIAERTDGGVLLLIGGPGAGKSAIAAEIARRHDAALHMMKTHRAPVRFVGSLVRQLLYRAGIAARAPAAADVDDLRTVLVDALEAQASVEGSAVMVIDGLDELADETGLEVLPRHPPPGARVILTSRPDQAILRRLRLTIGDLQEKVLPALGATEVQAVLEKRAGRPIDGAVVERVVTMTAGLPLLVRHAGEALRQSDGPLALDSLPGTLSAFAAETYRAIRGLEGDAEERGRIFQLLAIAHEAIGAAELQALLELEGRVVSPERCRAHLEAMTAFLIEPQAGAFVPFHEALADFVGREILGQAGVRKAEKLFADWTSDGLGAGYPILHHIRHLVAAGERDGARAALEQVSTLQAKLRHGLVFELVGELDLVGSALAPPVRRHAHFLARHPYALSSVLDVESAGVRIRAIRPPSASAVGGAELFVLRGHEGEVYSVALAADGQLLASAAGDATLRLWDIASAGLRRSIAMPARRALSVAISADGQRIACGTDGAGVIVVDPNGEVLQRAAEGSVVWSVDFAGDGRLATGGRSGDVEVRDPAGAITARLSTDGIVTAVAFSRDGERIAAATTRGKIVVADSNGGVLWRAGPLADTPWALAWTPEHGLIAGCADGVVREWDEHGTPRRERAVPDDHLYAAALSPDGALLAFAGKRGLLHTATQGDENGDDEIAAATAHDGAVNALAFAAADDLVVSGSSDGTVRGFRASALRAARPEGARPHALALSPAGDVVATGHFDGALRLVRAGVDLADLAVVSAHASRITDIAFSRDGSFLATASQDATAKIFRVAPLVAPGGKRAPIADLTGHEGAVTCVDVIGAGGRVATGSRDRTARVWSVFGARQLHVIGHDETVIAIAGDEEGSRVATLARDGSLLVFDVESGTVVARGKADIDGAAPHQLAWYAADVLRVHERGGAASVFRIDGSALRSLDLKAARAFLPRFMLRTDPRWQESVLVDSSTSRPVAAFPGVLALAVGTETGERFAGWWAGDLQIFDVEPD